MEQSVIHIEKKNEIGSLPHNTNKNNTRLIENLNVKGKTKELSNFLKYLFIYLFIFGLHRVLLVARGIFCCGAWAQLPRSMWDLSSPTRDPLRPLHCKTDS